MKDSALAARTLPAAADYILRQAIAHHHAGRLPDAERGYREVLLENPRHPDANHNLGILMMQSSQPDKALPHFEAALAVDPSHGQFRLSYIEALLHAGQPDRARKALKDARQHGLRGERADALAAQLGMDIGGKPVQQQQKSAKPQQTAKLPPGKGPAPEELNRVVALFNGSHLAQCGQAALALTQHYPNHGFGWKVLGLVLAQQGRMAEALPAMQKTAELFPEEADAHYNLGVVLAAEGKFPEAEAAYRRALKLVPDYLEAQANLGNALSEQGRHRAAEAAYRRALELDPANPQLHNNLGNALKKQEQNEEAEAAYRKAIGIAPDYAEAHRNLGAVLFENTRFDEAEKSILQALALNPNDADAHNHLGLVLDEFGRFDEAEASFRRALAMKPEHVDAHINLSHTLKTAGRTAEAEISLKRALELAPEHAGALAAMGGLLYDQGQFVESEQWLHRALAIQPKMPGPWSQLAHLRKMKPDDMAWIKTAEEILQEKLSAEQESALRYAMGKYCDDTMDYDRGFENYHRANELKKTFAPLYDREANERKIERLMLDYSDKWLNRRHPGASDSTRPLIIVGMPRSGTSLTEQIIASHPATFGAGELHFWDDAASRLNPAAALADLDERLIGILTDECLKNLDRFSTTAQRVVDKMPGNFYNVGLIHTVFPNARILHTQRNPIDTCLSIYFQNFNVGHTYASDLEDLAHYYKQYRRIMAHWRAVLPPEVFLDVPYDALVEDQEGWSRRIIEFIGLEWNDSCLDFHETERKVGTASNWQVRQKIYKSSKDRWRNYEKHVGPLLELLEL